MIKRLENWILIFQNRLSYQVAILVVITLAAAALRLYKLGEWSFWGDELITIKKALNIHTQRDFPSVSLLGIRLVLSGFGVTEWSARIVPTLIGSLSITAFYFPIRKIFGPFTAILAVTFLAISPWHLYWSQNARFYTSLLLFFNLSLLFFYLGLEENKPGIIFLSFVFFGLALLERHIALFFVPIAAGYLILMKLQGRDMPVGLRPRMIGVILVPSIITVVFLSSEIMASASRFLEAYDSLANNTPFWIMAGSVYYIGIPMIALGCLGLYALYIQQHRAFFILGLGAFVPLIGTMGLSLFMYTANRYVFVSLVSWAILASFGIVELIKKSQGYTKFLAAGSLIIVLLASMSDNLLYFMVQHGNRADWKAAVELIEDQIEPGDRIFSSSPEVLNYYIQSERTVNFKRFEPSNEKEADSRAWIILDNIAESYHPLHYRWVLRNARLMEAYDVSVTARTFKMRVYLLDPANGQ